MKKLTQIGLLLALILGFSSQAKADLLIEPVAGYSFGTWNVDIESGDSNDYNLNGLSYGGRLGYQNLGFQLGVDYLASTLNMEDSSDDLKTSEWAGFVGFEFPILFRVYAGYIFSGSGEAGDSDFSGGTGPKLGVGFTLLPFLDLNLEYRKVTYESEKVLGLETDFDYSAFMLGVSLPFTI